ncbi:hypothetical protein JXB27_02490 [Candidatus Woesearchaeota archaeon]|nr:hypothetical protein [Candidatus Woesearchaeota archaeon]
MQIKDDNLEKTVNNSYVQGSEQKQKGLSYGKKLLLYAAIAGASMMPARANANIVDSITHFILAIPKAIFYDGVNFVFEAPGIAYEAGSRGIQRIYNAVTTMDLDKNGTPDYKEAKKDWKKFVKENVTEREREKVKGEAKHVSDVAKIAAERLGGTQYAFDVTRAQGTDDDPLYKVKVMPYGSLLPKEKEEKPATGPRAPAAPSLGALIEALKSQ